MICWMKLRVGALSALFLLLGLPGSLCGVSMFVQPSGAFFGQAFLCLGAIGPEPLYCTGVFVALHCTCASYRTRIPVRGCAPGGTSALVKGETHLFLIVDEAGPANLERAL